MTKYTKYGYHFVDLNKLILIVCFILNSEPFFGKYRGSTVNLTIGGLGGHYIPILLNNFVQSIIIYKMTYS